MGNCASAASLKNDPLVYPPPPSQSSATAHRTSTASRLSEQLSIARRASRELVKRMSAEPPMCFTAPQYKDETKRRGGLYAHRAVADFNNADAESVVGDLADTHTIPEMMVATLQATHSMTTVESDMGSDDGTTKLRLPPPRKGGFSNDTPNTAIMSHFVDADNAISGMRRY